jgi:hypothetical protein
MRQDDPYAGLGTVEQEATDPYEGLGVVETPPPPPKPDTSLTQNVGVATSALSPYATAFALGAAAGAPFAGVGAIPGALGGVLSLGLADLGTGVYNAAVPMFGGQRV